jgi:hypothetical protein
VGVNLVNLWLPTIFAVLMGSLDFTVFHLENAGQENPQ